MFERANGMAVSSEAVSGELVWRSVSDRLSAGFLRQGGMLQGGAFACAEGQLVFIGDAPGYICAPADGARASIETALVWLRQVFVRFAAVWVGERSLELVTDHAAMVPLFYRLSGGGISIATSGRLLAASDGECLQLVDYRGERPLPHLGESNFVGVSAVPAGSTLRIQFEGRQWRVGQARTHAPLPAVPDIYRLDDAVALTIDALSASVTESLRGERSAALTLSGGIDSAAVAFLARQSVSDLHSFTVGTPYGDEFVPAREVASFVGTKHQEVHMTMEDAEELLPELITSLETWDPLTLQIAMPVAHLYRVLAGRYPLFLTGYGSDLIHGGVADITASAPAVEQSLLEGIALTVPTNELSHQVSARHGTLVRYPYWTYRSQVAALRISGRLKIAESTVKHAFRKSMATFLPPEIAWRRKIAIHEGTSMKSLFDGMFTSGDPASHLDNLKAIACTALAKRETALVG